MVAIYVVVFGVGLRLMVCLSAMNGVLDWKKLGGLLEKVDAKP